MIGNHRLRGGHIMCIEDESMSVHPDLILRRFKGGPLLFSLFVDTVP